ncbi:DUF397 domain-containing protein [Streptomyces bambusae]|nr:DUF397 domain-containing protein [Streptomyces bambusae]
MPSPPLPVPVPVPVHGSKVPDGPILVVPAARAAFVTGLKT